MAGLWRQSAQVTLFLKVCQALGHVELIFTLATVPNPLGVVAVLSAFNFPVAVYGW